jgi:hypothetical protein
LVDVEMDDTVELEVLSTVGEVVITGAEGETLEDNVVRELEEVLLCGGGAIARIRPPHTP